MNESNVVINSLYFIIRNRNIEIYCLSGIQFNTKIIEQVTLYQVWGRGEIGSESTNVEKS